jgi:hypothetical protein
MVNYKGRDRIEFGYKPYAEASYGSSPGAVATTLYKIGYCRSIEPAYDPEWNRLWVLRDTATPAPIGMLSRKLNAKFRFTWYQGTLANYILKEWLTDHDNLYMEAKLYREAASELYMYWTGVKPGSITVRASVGGDPIEFVAECIGKLYDVKTSTIHDYGAAPGDPWEWKDSYLQVSTDDISYATIPNVTDYEFHIQNQLRPVFYFNAAGAKTLSSLEEMEQLVSVNLTMNLQDSTWVDYHVDGTELYIKLMLPDSKYLKLNAGRVTKMDPVLKPEDLIACRATVEGRWLSHNFT